MTHEHAKSLHDFQRHFRDPSRFDEDPPPSVRWWRLAKRMTLALLLAVAFLLYYLVDKFIEALALL